MYESFKFQYKINMVNSSFKPEPLDLMAIQTLVMSFFVAAVKTRKRLGSPLKVDKSWHETGKKVPPEKLFNVFAQKAEKMEIVS